MPFPDIKRLPIPLPLLIIIVGGLLITLLVVFKPSAEIRPTGNLNPLVKTLMAEPAAHSPMITLYGRVESPRESNLAATVNAYVDSVPVEEGDMVTKGQVLVELEDSDVRRVYEQRQAEVADMEAQIASEKERYQNDLASLEVEKKLLALSKKSAERYEKLVAKNVGSDLNRDEALQLAQKQELSLYNRQYAVKDHPNRLKRLNAQLQKLTAFRDQAATDLARTKITAPFNGRVIQLKASPGNRVHPGDIVIDGGANTGIFTCAFGMLGASVHAFEPLPGPRDQLARNVALNGIEHRTRIVPVAIGEADAWAEMSIGRGPVSASIVHGEGETVRVEVQSLDSYLATAATGRISFAKLDIEGAETAALRGASALIARDRPAICLEVWREDELDEIRALLGPHGYRLCELTFDGEAALPQPFHPIANLIALPDNGAH